MEDVESLEDDEGVEDEGLEDDEGVEGVENDVEAAIWSSSSSKSDWSLS